MLNGWWWLCCAVLLLLPLLLPLLLFATSLACMYQREWWRTGERLNTAAGRHQRHETARAMQSSRKNYAHVIGPGLCRTIAFVCIISTCIIQVIDSVRWLWTCKCLCEPLYMIHVCMYTVQWVYVSVRMYFMCPSAPVLFFSAYIITYTPHRMQYYCRLWIYPNILIPTRLCCALILDWYINIYQILDVSSIFFGDVDFGRWRKSFISDMRFCVVHRT